MLFHHDVCLSGVSEIFLCYVATYRMIRIMLLPVDKSFPNKFKIVYRYGICLCNKKLLGFVLRLFDCVYVVPYSFNTILFIYSDI